MTEKQCSKCGEVKAVSEFSKHTSHKDGLQSQCNACLKQYRQEHKAETAKYGAQYYQENKAEIAAHAAQYRQENKAEIAEYKAQYYKEHKSERAQYLQENKTEIAEYCARYRQEHRAEAEQYYQEHKEETEKKKAQYRQEHKAEIIAYQAQYYQEHKAEQAKRMARYHQTPKGKAVSRAAWHRRRGAPGGKRLSAETLKSVIDASTGICPYCGDPFTDGHVDHIFPASLGGTSDPDNLAYVCPTCNMRKGARTLLEFFEYLNTVEDDYEIPVEHLTRVIPSQHLEGIV